MTDFYKANMDGSFEREFDSNKTFRRKGKRIYTVEVVDEDLKVHWCGVIEGARGTKNARDLWRNQYPEIRKQFIGKGFMVRVKTNFA